LTSGTLYYDKKDLDILDIREVRRQIGTVLQNSQLLPGDIYRNIVGTLRCSTAEAWEAAKMVGLDEDIRLMPMEMNTVIGLGCSTLSEGQKQRILIARAIVHKPRILFFDEATSALDNRTQDIVSRSLERLKVTRLVIAHRLSTIINADRIYVLDAGEIVQAGTYRELVQKPGVFKEMAERQIL
ncbi:MAG: ATP-binding cassette domain-containing protein, partial [Desulfobacteraceae bacterium]